MWKFHDFTVTQILREINFRDYRSVKSANFVISEALNFDFYEFLQFLKAEIHQSKKIQSSKLANKVSFGTSRYSKIDFT